jgi:hypothetical protein
VQGLWSHPAERWQCELYNRDIDAPYERAVHPDDMSFQVTARVYDSYIYRSTGHYRFLFRSGEDLSCVF